MSPNEGEGVYLLGYTGQRDESWPGWDEAGQHEISSHYSKGHKT